MTDYVAGPELDAVVADALGWRAWKERRGDYTLCVLGHPGAREPWLSRKTPDPERYEQTTCAEAVKIGFHGTEVPRFSRDMGSVWLVVLRMREIMPPRCQNLSLVAYAYNRTYATFDPDVDEWVEANGPHATPLAICKAALVAIANTATPAGTP